MDTDRTAEEVLDRLRRPERRTAVLGGFGPLAVAIAAFVLMVLLLPSVAPERIVERPAGSDTTVEADGP